MKWRRYAISVSYGNGFHHFRKYSDSDPSEEAKAIEHHLMREWETRPPALRGAKPQVTVWQQVERT